ncbi:hypothetical protein I546_1214 [Mycobacterium kansasii 732]|nr:hypothetical protein I546_1214 [Mycobacterium kansasii 732]
MAIPGAVRQPVPHVERPVADPPGPGGLGARGRPPPTTT